MSHYGMLTSRIQRDTLASTGTAAVVPLLAVTFVRMDRIHVQPARSVMSPSYYQLVALVVYAGLVRM